MSLPLPAPVFAKIRAFLDARATGDIVLNVQNGRIRAWKLTECGHISDPPPPEPAGLTEPGPPAHTDPR